jgi:RHS repeat-associated protein
VRVKYHFGDQLGSSHVLIGGASSREDGFISREEYFSYGETSLGSYVRKRYRYSGKECDAESSLYFYGARYYSPWLARWVSTDPAGPIDGRNLFCAFRNNPNLFVDKQGTDTVSGTPPTIEEINAQPLSPLTASPVAGYTGGLNYTPGPPSQSNALVETEKAKKPEAERFTELQRSFPYKRDPNVSSIRNYLIDKYASLAAQQPEAYTGNIYPDVLPPSTTTANYSAAASSTANDPVNNRTRWALQFSLLQYGLEYGYNELTRRAQFSTEFSYQIHKQAFGFANGVPTIGRLPWALLTHVNVPRVGEHLGDFLYFPEAFGAGMLAGFGQWALDPINPESANTAFDRVFNLTMSKKYNLGGIIINGTIETTNSPRGVGALPWYGRRMRSILDDISVVTHPLYD